MVCACTCSAFSSGKKRMKSTKERTVKLISHDQFIILCSYIYISIFVLTHIYILYICICIGGSARELVWLYGSTWALIRYIRIDDAPNVFFVFVFRETPPCSSRISIIYLSKYLSINLYR
jgi:hypothetical protein